MHDSVTVFRQKTSSLYKIIVNCPCPLYLWFQKSQYHHVRVKINDHLSSQNWQLQHKGWYWPHRQSSRPPLVERTGEQSYRYRQQSSLIGAIILEVNESSTTVMEAWWGERGDTGEGREIWVSGARAPPPPPSAVDTVGTTNYNRNNMSRLPRRGLMINPLQVFVKVK